MDGRFAHSRAKHQPAPSAQYFERKRRARIRRYDEGAQVVLVRKGTAGATEDDVACTQACARGRRMRRNLSDLRSTVSKRELFAPASADWHEGDAEPAWLGCVCALVILRKRREFVRAGWFCDARKRGLDRQG